MTIKERTSCARNAATGTLRKRGELRTTNAWRSLPQIWSTKLRHASDVVCNAGRFGNYRAAARQPGIVPGKKKKMQNN